MVRAYEPVIGIDLGTTYSCVGLFKADGSIEILKEDGHATVPSVICFTSQYKTEVGHAAYRAAAAHEERSLVYDVKRLIGKNLDHPETQNANSSWPFQIVQDEQERIRIKRKEAPNEEQYCEEFSAIVLEKMKAIAEQAAGQEITKAVVTVPAYFTKSQKQATKDACTIAGLDCLRMISEPTSASIAYRLTASAGTFDDEKDILVFDYGGGTLDVSILHIEGYCLEVAATSGNTFLGGRDFDEAIVKWCIQSLKEDMQIDLEDEREIITSRETKEQLREACEKAKKHLDNHPTARIELTNINGEGRDWSIELTVEKFEELISVFKDSFIECIEKARQDASNAGIDNIGEVVLVGGSTKTPYVRNQIQEHFGDGVRVNAEINPDTVVAYGAAIYAGKLTGQVGDAEADEIVLNDVTPLPIGLLQSHQIEQGFLARIFSKAKFEERMDIYLNKNMTIPIEKSKTITITENDKSLIILEGENEFAKDNMALGEIPLAGYRAGDKVDVRFKIDENNILTVGYVIARKGKSQQTTIMDKQNLDEALVDSLSQAAEHRRAAAAAEQ